jgi:hypothetical protein
MGGYALIFDPKGERGDWPDKLPMLRGLINIVTLGPEMANHGKLDPFLVYEGDYAEASTLAYNVICELFRLPQNSDETLMLTEALDAMEREQAPCMQKLCEIIEDIQRKEKAENMKNAADRLARNIRSMRRRGMAALMFGTGREKAIRLDNRLNIFQIQNLKLPEPETEKDDFTPEEAASVVLMTILGNIARKFAMKKRNVFSTILFDESWALGRTAEGIKLYNFLARMGRSLNCGCIFNGHSVLDIPSAGVRNAITYKFCFNTENTEEAERMLELLDMEITQDNIDLIKGLGNGECLFRDLDGRVGVLKFDAVFADIIEAFNTTPKSKQQVEAENASKTVIDLKQYLLDHPREHPAKDAEYVV